jgi:hypothetical protein
MPPHGVWLVNVHVNTVTLISFDPFKKRWKEGGIDNFNLRTMYLTVKKKDTVDAAVYHQKLS